MTMKKIILLFLLTITIVSISNAQWQKIKGSVSGKINCFAVDSMNIYVGTEDGVFISKNNDSSWTAASTGLTNKKIQSLAISGTNIFAGTAGGGMFLSTNKGASWSAVNSGLTNTTVLSIAISGTNIFAGTKGGVFLSGNNGGSWSLMNVGLTNTVIHSLAISGTSIFAGTDEGVFLSGNIGLKWTAVNSGLTNTHIWSLIADGANIFAGTNSGIFLSTNNGTSWINKSQGLSPNTWVCSFAQSEKKIFAATDVGLFSSTDAGVKWSGVNITFKNNHLNTIFVNGNNVYAGTMGDGVWRSSLLALKDKPNEKDNVGKNKSLIIEQSAPILLIVETMPTFVGGEEELYKFLANNIKYPQVARETNITGTVIIQFVVETDGSISGATLLKDIGGGCGTEALRVVNEMPKWIPGKQDGLPCRVQYNLPVRFSLD